MELVLEVEVLLANTMINDDGAMVAIGLVTSTIATMSLLYVWIHLPGVQLPLDVSRLKVKLEEIVNDDDIIESNIDPSQVRELI